MFGLQGSEIIIILVLVLILFGAKRLPELARGVGQGMREFRQALNTPPEETKDKSADDSKG